jgi:hypothetical protein
LAPVVDGAESMVPKLPKKACSCRKWAMEANLWPQRPKSVWDILGT